GSILAPWDIRRPAVLRLDQNGAWFGHANGERRVGGRIAVAGLVRIAASDVCCVSVHLESHSNPEERAGQMTTLIDAIDQCYGECPTIIGGDFNTSTIDARTEKRRASKARLARADRDRLADPIRFEPLFGVASRAGYDWTASNAPGTTTRKGPHEPPDKPMEKIDWFFTRGLCASDPRIIPAVDQNGLAISDHELLAVTVKPAQA
ncbi:MAG: endonuclease, partial [Alphaproteobacteria bacterium]